MNNFFQCLISVTIFTFSISNVFAAALNQTLPELSVDKVQDFIETADKAIWKNAEKGTIVFGDSKIEGEKVEYGVKKGGINGTGSYSNGKLIFDPHMQSKTIDITLDPTSRTNDLEIRGSYFVELPDTKSI